MVIDEIQRAPELLLAIKATVDADPRPGRFLLTGSSRLLALRDLPDTLPGRMETIELYPFSQGEIDRTPDRFIDAVFRLGADIRHESSVTRTDYAERIVRGGLPEAVALDRHRPVSFVHMTFAGTPRLPLRWHHAETELDDFAVVTFRVASEALAAHLPAGFAPREVAFDDGATGALVSAVAFVDRRFHFRFCSPVSISCGQINYRAYVSAHGRPGVWFFATSLDHPIVVLPRLMWGMPWQRSRIEIDADWSDSAGRWRLTATDRSGKSVCDAVETGPVPDRLDGFVSREGWQEFLTHPTSGWYRRPDGRVGEYSIWHPPMVPRLFEARSARFPLFEQLGLVGPDAVPHSILAQRTLHFDVHTPPRRYLMGG